MSDVTGFEWPCHRRDAHGPHDRAWIDPCPGVKAHPATMIGRPVIVSSPSDTITPITNPDRVTPE